MILDDSTMKGSFFMKMKTSYLAGTKTVENTEKGHILIEDKR